MFTLPQYRTPLWPGHRYVPSLSRDPNSIPVLTSSKSFRYVISSSLTLVSMHLTCRDRSLDFSSTLTTEALDLSSLRRFEINSYQPITGGHSPSPMQHGLLHTKLPSCHTVRPIHDLFPFFIGAR